MHLCVDGGCNLCRMVRVTTLPVSTNITYLGLDGGPLLRKDVFHETVDEIGQLRVFQHLGRDLEQPKVSLHESLV